MADNEKKVNPDTNADKASAEEKAAQKVAKAAKGNNKKDKPNFFVRAKKGSKKFFKDFKGECKKIEWPDAKTVLKSTGVVLVVVAIVSVFVFALDFGLKEGIEQLKLAAIGEVVTDGNVTDGNATAGNVEAEHDHTHAEDEAEETEAETEAEETKAEDTTAEDAE